MTAHMMFDAAWGWVAGLLWTAFLVGAVVLVLALLRRRGGGPGTTPALRVLEERYAGGEIGREEFLERRAVLLDGAGAPRSAGDAG